jgi:hypothetical protein
MMTTDSAMPKRRKGSCTQHRKNHSSGRRQIKIAKLRPKLRSKRRHPKTILKTNATMFSAKGCSATLADSKGFLSSVPHLYEQLAFNEELK